MKLSSIQKNAVCAVLSGSYTPHDLREFVRLCHLIVRPHLSGKIRSGKLDISLLGISEDDAVYDCMADVFRRDVRGRFVEIEIFFGREVGDHTNVSGELLLMQLRRLVIGKVNNNIVRLHGEADPVLGKILRNIRLALSPDLGLEQVTRFNETYLSPVGIDPLPGRPPFSFESLRRAASGVILIHDNIPGMLAKLRSLLVEQTSHQRIVPLVWAGMVFKEVYTLGWEPAEDAVDLDSALESERLTGLVEKICLELNAQLRKTYVETGKLTEGLLEGYCCALRNVLNGSYLDDHLDGSTFYEYLREHVPDLTRESYRAEHKATLEYIVRLGKNRLRQELRLK